MKKLKEKKLVKKEIFFCKLCNRPLRSKASIKRGYGGNCYKKFLDQEFQKRYPPAIKPTEGESENKTN